MDNGSSPFYRSDPMETVVVNSAYLRWLRRVSLVEGVSTLVLFGVAMPLKYLADMPLAVTVGGSLHGGLFLVLALMFLAGIQRIPLGSKLAWLGIVAAILPFGPFVFDAHLRRLERRES